MNAVVLLFGRAKSCGDWDMDMFIEAKLYALIGV